MFEPSELLFDYALGHLEPEARARLEVELASSPALRAELVEVLESLGAVACAAPPAEPSPKGRARLEAALAAPSVAARAFRALEDLFDLGSREVGEVLQLITRPERWTESGVPGFSFVHFAGGARTTGLECGLIRLSAGFSFPQHRHLSEEVTVVVSGRYTDSSSGQVFGPGDISRLPAGSEHAFQVHADEDLIYAIQMVRDAVEIDWPSP